MAAYLLALLGDATQEQLFADDGAPPDLPVRRVASAADALRVLEAEGDACRLLLLERERAPQLAQFIERVRRTVPGLHVVLLSAAVSDGVREELHALGLEFMDRGRPVNEILHTLRRTYARCVFQAETGILGRSPRIHEVLETVLQIGPTDIPVLITGPSGSGKELVARACYRASRRAERPFVAINVGALSESVLESELFGHEKGAFTGAIARKAGVFERADGGTLFLDEVGEMSENMQVRLLRALETGDITPVGGQRTLHVDVRVLAATNRPLEEAVRRGTFREDLYYRLKVVHIEVPSLRERREDIPELALTFLMESARKYHTPARSFSDAALRALQRYDWPGNVRELRNVVASVAVLAQGERIEVADLPAQVRSDEPTAHLPVATHRTHADAERELILQSLLALRQDLQEVLRLLRERQAPARTIVVEPVEDGERVQDLRENEKELIRSALAAVGGNRRRAAQRLGIAERTLYRKIREYGLR